MKKIRPLLIAGTVITGIILLFLIGSLYISNRLENELQNQQIGSYILKSKEVRVNLFSNKINLRDVTVENSHEGNFLSIPEANAQGIAIIPWLLYNEITINSVSIQSPEYISHQILPDNEAEADIEPDTTQTRKINAVTVEKINIYNLSFLIKNQMINNDDSLMWFNSSLELWNLKLNNPTEILQFNNHSAERIHFSIQNFTYPLPGDLYILNFDSLTFDTKPETLVLQNLQLTTLPSKDEIGSITGEETEWFDISLNQLELYGIDIGAMLKDSAIIFRKAVLAKLDAHIFRDKRPPFPEKPDTRLPMEMLENLPVHFHSDSVLITGSNVVYEELGEESTETGWVSFNNLYATVYNLSTLSDSVNGPTAMSAQAMVMNQALLQAEFIFPNDKHSSQYKASGNLAPISFAAFNSITKPAAFIRINDGMLNRLDFDFSYNNDNSTGKLFMEYENLSISILDKDDGSEKKFKTFLTQTFILNQNNKETDNLYQEGTISFERDKKRSVFNYWWKSLLSGIQNILAF